MFFTLGRNGYFLELFTKMVLLWHQPLFLKGVKIIYHVYYRVPSEDSIYKIVNLCTNPVIVIRHGAIHKLITVTAIMTTEKHAKIFPSQPEWGFSNYFLAAGSWTRCSPSLVLEASVWLAFSSSSLPPSFFFSPTSSTQDNNLRRQQRSIWTGSMPQ